MRDYGRVYSTFWTSEDTRALSDDGRMLALYLLSGPHGTIAGVCRLPDGYVCEDLKWSPKRVSEGFGELFRKGFANRCGTTKWVWICRFLAWNTPENPNQWKAARKIASSVPSNCSWKAAFSRVFELAAGGESEPLPEPSGNPFETVPERLPTQEQDQKQEQYQKQEQEKERVAKATAPPDPVPGLNQLAWETWAHYRTSIKKPLKAASIEAAQRQLAAHGNAQLAVVEQSIANGWQGLFELKSTNGSGTHRPPTRRPKTLAELEAEEAANNAQH